MAAAKLGLGFYYTHALPILLVMDLPPYPITKLDYCHRLDLWVIFLMYFRSSLPNVHGTQ